MLELRSVLCVLLILLCPGIVWSQTQITDQIERLNGQETPIPQNDSASKSASQRGPAAGAGEAQDQQKKEDAKPKQDDQDGQQTKRMLWVVPNFSAVSANKQLPPLSTHEKFVLAMHDSMDYSSFTWAGILAAQGLFLNSVPDLGHGWAGYGRYYWRTYADGVSGAFFTEAIVPSITHEDPRYYTLGHGGFFRRTGYALSRVFVTKTDSGGTSFNWSEVVGNGLESGLSNAYYPASERGLTQTARSWGTQVESAALNNIFKEFWPDIRRHLFRGK